MLIDCYRIFETDRSITSRVGVNGLQFCFALEPSRFHPVHPGHPCIPCGVYKVKLSHSSHLGYVTPELLDVPGRTEIRIHKGNEPKDTLGCTVVGTSIGKQADWVNDSHDAFDLLLARCEAAEGRDEEITAEYHDLAKRESPQETTA